MGIVKKQRPSRVPGPGFSIAVGMSVFVHSHYGGSRLMLLNGKVWMAMTMGMHYIVFAIQAG